MKKVFLDAGHGGHDPGAVGNGEQEKDIALLVTLAVGQILKRHNVDVSYSRTTDVFVELHNRAVEANRVRSDVFVSIHCNSFSKPSAQGVEVFSYPGSGAGKLLAKNILDEIVRDKLYTRNRGLKTANFAVLRRTQMPACLVELGFISNKEDIAILTNKQDELATAVAKGILSNLGLKYKGASHKETPKANDPYPGAVKTLMDHGIIGTPEAWADASKIKPASARSLLIKMANYINQGV